MKNLKNLKKTELKLNLFSASVLVFLVFIFYSLYSFLSVCAFVL